MNNLEQQFIEEKQRLDAMTAPEELEARLRSALNAAPVKRKGIRPFWKIAAAAVLLVAVISNNYPAFAYYGKKIFGYEELMSGTLQELNDQGLGQSVDKSIKLHDGTELTIEGIMSDANQLIMYYRLSNSQGLDEDTYSLFTFPRMTGFLTNSRVESGMSMLSEDQTEIRGTATFEPVSPFAKKLTLEISEQLENNQMTSTSLTFPYRPDQAMQTEYKQSIRTKVQVDQGTINFTSITATPTMTLIKGSLDVRNFDRVSGSLHGIELVANGTPVEIMGSGNQSSYLGGRNFEIRFDTLPKQLDSLELIVNEFAGYEKLDMSIPLQSSLDEPISLSGRALWVKDVALTSQGVEITIATDYDIILDKVSIQTSTEITPLQTTVRQIDAKQADGSLMKERTMLFETTRAPEALLIEGMHYMKVYNESIHIPVD